MVATAYTCDPTMNPAQKAFNCPNGKTATGTKPVSGRTLACGPSFRGKQVFIQGLGKRVCEDRGGAITDDRIDVYVDTYQEAMQFGKREVTVL